MAKKSGAAGAKQESGSGDRQRMEQIIGEMQVKLKEIDSLRYELKKEQDTGLTPAISRQMLEEIVVPSLESIRSDRKRR